jgi:L-fuculose-phosphate aldolase
VSGFQDEREQVAYFMRRLYRQCLTTTSGGNLSCRAGSACIALTPTGVDKGELLADQVGIMGLDGTNVTPHLKPSIESAMHLAIYHRFPGVKAVVHAHPLTASFFCACDETINTHLTAEAYAILGEPVMTPYCRMGTTQLAEAVVEGVGRGVCVLLRSHGILTVGETLLQAFDRLEVLEVAARQTLMMRSLQGVRELNAPQRRELDVYLGRQGPTSDSL